MKRHTNPIVNRYIMFCFRFTLFSLNIISMVVLFSDDEFRELVDKVPKDARITIISDSCHSGGLIDEAKEQIGESTKKKKKPKKEAKGSSRLGIKDFVLETVEQEDEETNIKEYIELENGDKIHVGNKSLPLQTLIDILKLNTGNDDIALGKIRPTLFNVFGEDASSKVKKFMKVLLTKLQEGENDQVGLMGMIGKLTQEFIEHKLNDNEENVGRKQEVYEGASKGSIADNGILISGCQTDQTSADASPVGQPELAYGAFTNAVQIILEESNGKVTYKELVMKARKLLKKQGFTQRPGLYCSGGYVNAPFIC